MGVFVSYYEYFKNHGFDKGELAYKLLTENPKATSLNAQKTRISNARRIFEENLHVEALEIIINSERVEESIIRNARVLLASEIKSI